uniref:DDHD domain-containing protein n=1 Tax=Trichuris muris TaxID=70415 RepID=A0A5S6QLR7_TRIMR
MRSCHIAYRRAELCNKQWLSRSATSTRSGVETYLSVGVVGRLIALQRSLKASTPWTISHWPSALVHRENGDLRSFNILTTLYYGWPIVSLLLPRYSASAGWASRDALVHGEPCCLEPKLTSMLDLVKVFRLVGDWCSRRLAAWPFHQLQNAPPSLATGMLIKEYRILLPLSVDEYRIAQLYMIQRKSQEETKGANSGVEIIVNEPYHHADGSSGQYTFKIYHVEGHLPAWFRSILPDSAMRIVEESWNAYPYTKTRFSCPFIDKFFLEVETKYFDDAGCQENVFNLSDAELNSRQVDVMDIVRDSISSADYKKEEDPKLYKSTVTGRGPLSDSWVEECISNGTAIMCAYKLCRVQFNYWGMQSKVEKFVHDFALRRTMLRAHRQVWAWQDEWFNLSMEDIRRLETQAQRVLQQLMAGNNVYDATCNESTAEMVSGRVGVDYSAFGRLNSTKEAQKAASSEEEDDEDDVYFDALEFNSVAEGDNHLGNRSGNEQIKTLERPIGKLGKLLLIFHGGHILDACSDQTTAHCKEQDVRAFSATLDNIVLKHYQSMEGVIAVRLVPCANVFCDSLKLLQGVCPYCSSQNRDGARKFWSFAPSLIPVMSTQSMKYSEELSRAVESANRVYEEFLNSEVGAGFVGEVSICGDAVGGLLAFDALCTPPASHAYSSNAKHWYTFCSTANEERLAESDPATQDGFSTLANGRQFAPPTGDRAGKLDRQSTITTLTESSTVPLKFPVENLFLFGTSLGLVLSSRRLSSGCHTLPACNCRNVYNLYYASDLSSARIEPLLLQEFSSIQPMKILPYSQFPLGDGQSLHMLDWLKMDIPNGANSVPSSPWSTTPSSPAWSATRLRGSLACLSMDTSSFMSKGSPHRASSAADSLSQWWGSKRIDYELFAPDDLLRLPFLSLSSFFYASFWESCDVAAFVLRQLLSGGTTRSSTVEADAGLTVGTADKWLRRHTGLKLKNVAANHRANDVIASENHRQVLMARFMYGPFDMIALSGECVDIYMMNQGPVGDWTYCGTELTDNHGRLKFELKNPLPVGLYPVRMIVKGDRTFSDLCLAVLPPETECVVFSIDGSFTASMSLTGRNPKVRPAAVDVARFWQDLDYLILYVSARPDVQQRMVTCWLAEHNFPFGLLFFNEGFSADLLKQKTNTLKSLTADCKIKIEVAYGSSKDVRGYRELGLDADHIFAIGKISKKLQPDCTPLLDGYSKHLTNLRNHDLPAVARPAAGKGQLVVQRSRFSFGDYLSSFRKSFSVHRTRSFTPQCSRRPFLGTSELKICRVAKRLSDV